MNKKVVKCELICHSDLNSFNLLINHMLREGWEFYGNVVVGTEGSAADMYFMWSQMMVKYEDESTQC